MQRNSLFSIQEKTILVTGATGHLGQAMCRAFAEAGANVMVCGRSIEATAELASSLSAMGYSARAFVFDVRDQSQIDRCLVEFRDRPLHVLVNNAYAGASGTIETSDAGDYRDSYEVSVVAAHNVVRSVLPGLRRGVEEAGDASVINVASMYGQVSPDLRVYSSSEVANPPFYGACKAAVIQWTRYAACEFGKYGIRVNSISPGPFPEIDGIDGDSDFISRLSHRVPLGRVANASEIEGPVLFLASGASSYVTGANLSVDGGWTAW